MYLRFYTIMIVPMLMTILLCIGVAAAGSAIQVDLTVPIGKTLERIGGSATKDLSDSQLKASGAAALYLGLLLLTPILLPPLKDDGLRKLRKRLKGDWVLAATAPTGENIPGTARIAINRDSGFLFIDGTWKSKEGRDIEWRAQGIYLDKGRLSYVSQTSIVGEKGGKAQRIRCLVDFDFTNQPSLDTLKGQWHLVEGEGSNDIVLRRR